MYDQVTLPNGLRVIGERIDHVRSVSVGLWLDAGLEPAAYLPGLCDIWGDMAIFDDLSGNLRQSRLYSLQELKDLGELYLRKEEE